PARRRPDSAPRRRPARPHRNAPSIAATDLVRVRACLALDTELEGIRILRRRRVHKRLSRRCDREPLSFCPSVLQCRAARTRPALSQAPCSPTPRVAHGRHRPRRTHPIARPAVRLGNTLWAASHEPHLGLSTPASPLASRSAVLRAPFIQAGCAPASPVRRAAEIRLMTKKMLIDAAHAEETRVVLVDGNRARSE